MTQGSGKCQGLTCESVWLLWNQEKASVAQAQSMETGPTKKMQTLNQKPSVLKNKDMIDITHSSRSKSRSLVWPIKGYKSAERGDNSMSLGEERNQGETS